MTPVDKALTCLDGKIKKQVSFSVGAIVDLTGKEQFTDGGSGKFVTQGAGDIVQSALYRAGTNIVNRRDPRIMEEEIKWGIQTPAKLIPSDYFVTGSINSLDFIPGGGVEAVIGGIGPTYSQNRILVSLDLSMTETKTGLIVSNVSLQKQIFADDINFGIGRFSGKTLLTINGGVKEREALHYSLRQMLNLATFDLLTQTMEPKTFRGCQTQIAQLTGIADIEEINKLQDGNPRYHAKSEAKSPEKPTTENKKSDVEQNAEDILWKIEMPGLVHEIDPNNAIDDARRKEIILTK